MAGHDSVVGRDGLLGVPDGSGVFQERTPEHEDERGETRRNLEWLVYPITLFLACFPFGFELFSSRSDPYSPSS
jgi:hypothetical protein